MNTYNKLANYFYHNIASPPASKPSITQIALILFTPVTTSFIIILYSANVPFYDQWRFVPLLNQMYDQKISFASLWEQHNEHRIFFPRILMLVLASLSKWDIRIEIGVIWVMAMLLFFVLCRAADRQFGSWNELGKLNRPYKIYIAFSILLFSMVQAENWFWGWQISLFMSVLSTVFGYYSLVFRPFGRNVSFLISIMCGIVAVLSFANGLLYWPIGIAIMLMNNFKKKWLIREFLLWALVTALLYFSYFYNYKQVSHHPSFLYGFVNPLNLVGYFIAFVGSPIFQAGRYITISFVVGFLGLITVIYFLITLFNQRRLFESKLLFWHGLLLYVLLTDILTALGRSGFGVEQALSGRYVTISNLFWIWLIVIGYELMKFREINKFYNFTPFVFSVATLFIILSGARNTKVCKLDRQKLLSQEEQLRKGKLDLKTLEKIYQESPALVLSGNNVLKKHHLSFYSH
ncbi:hypothetical protein LC612_40785 [Nostoc sp. CHAB 5834]|nr:hypothetical protein [Nostoc sp. CHAB 5834]